MIDVKSFMENYSKRYEPKLTGFDSRKSVPDGNL
jgi:hypothetical protein